MLFRAKWHVDLFVGRTPLDGLDRNDLRLGADGKFMTSIFAVLHAESGTFGARQSPCEKGDGGT